MTKRTRPLAVAYQLGDLRLNRMIDFLAAKDTFYQLLMDFEEGFQENTRSNFDPETMGLFGRFGGLLVLTSFEKNKCARH